MKSKAQTEIVGIVFIVLILVIAGVIMIGMRLNREEPVSQGYIDPELAQSFLNVILKTKADNNAVVKDILEACYDGRHDLCGGNCCEYGRKTISNALQATLGKWKKPYRLTITNRRTGQKLIPDIPENSECDEFADKYQPSYRYISSLELRLDICK